jgi:putative transposase
MRDRLELSERRACDLVGMCRSTVRDWPTESETNRWLLSRLPELAAIKPRDEYRRLYTLVPREGQMVNHKRVYRLYTVLGLAVRRNKRERVSQANRRPGVIPQRANDRWSRDFMSDVLADSRRLRTLNLIDDATRECQAIEVDTSIGGSRVARVLDQVASWRGLPQRIIVDNGSEITSKPLDQWAYERAIELRFIRPERLTENCIIESFNGRFRDECRNLNWFTALGDARTLIATWRHDYNHFRPHSSLGGKPPVEFAEQAGLRPTTSASVLLAAHIGTHEDHPRC